MTANKKYDYMDRLIAFAGDCILFVGKQNPKTIGKYLFDQLMRSSGTAALNFAEAQSAVSDKDYINKASIALKELRESEVNLKIMKHVNYGESERERLQAECIECIKILSTIIKNRKFKMKNT